MNALGWTLGTLALLVFLAIGSLLFDRDPKPRDLYGDRTPIPEDEIVGGGRIRTVRLRMARGVLLHQSRCLTPAIDAQAITDDRKEGK